MKTLRTIGLIALSLAWTGWLGAVPTAQKRSLIPVDLSYQVPPGLKPGDEVKTVFTFTAKSQVPVLEVLMQPVEGLEWLEGEKRTTFENVGEGQRREVSVRLRLTGAAGKLSLSMRAIYGENRFGRSVLVRYGEPESDGAGQQ